MSNDTVPVNKDDLRLMLGEMMSILDMMDGMAGDDAVLASLREEGLEAEFHKDHTRLIDLVQTYEGLV